MRTLATLALLLLPILAASAGAATPPTCASIAQAGLTPYGPYAVPVFGEGTQYDVWAEENLQEGLQTQDCLAADGTVVAKDRYLGRYGFTTGGNPICVPKLGCVF